MSRHFRFIRFSDEQKVVLLLPLLQPSYAEEIRRQQVSKFIDAVNVIYKYDQFLNNTGARPTPTVNAIGYSSSDSTPSSQIQALEEAAVRSQDEIRQLKAQLASYQSGQASAKWCSLHKVSTLSNAECRAQKSKQQGGQRKFNQPYKKLNQVVNSISKRLDELATNMTGSTPAQAKK